MRDILLLVILIGLVPMILRRPFVGVLAWCWLSYMVPHRLAFGFMASFPSAQVIAIACLLTFFFSKEPKSIPKPSPIIWLFVLYLWMILTYLTHDQTEFVNYLAGKVFKIQLFTLIILAMLTTRKRIEGALWVVALSIGFYGFKGGIYTLLTGGGGRVLGPPGGFFEGNNELGLALVIIVPILLYLVTTLDKKWQKIIVWSVIGFSAISVLGTQSRGALVAIIACGAFLWLKSDKKLMITGLLIVAIPSGIAFMPQSWHERMDTIVESNEDAYDSSVKGRFNAWRMSINIASDQIFGGGFNAATRANFLVYAPDPLDFHDFHSIYFQMLGKHGWGGLLIFLMMYYFTWRLAGKTAKLVEGDEELEWAGRLCRMLQVSLIAYAAGGAFLGLAYFDLPFHILITIVAISTVINKKLKVRETQISVIEG